MIYNNTSSENLTLFKNLFKQPIGVACEPEQQIILEKLLNICKSHIFEEFPYRLEFEGYYKNEYKNEYKPVIYGDNYIINNFYRIARKDNDRNSYKESFHISIKAIINNIPVSSKFWVVWKDIGYSLDASKDILELLCIAPYWIHTKIYKYPSI